MVPAKPTLAHFIVWNTEIMAARSYVLLLVLFLAACANITRGADENMTFVSDPPGASVRTSTGETCTTPCTIPVSRRAAFTANFSKAGYRDQIIQVTVQSSTQGTATMLSNGLFFTGMLVDKASGATEDHVPNPVIANLEPLNKLAPRGTVR